LKGVVGNDLHAPACCNGLERLSHGVGLKDFSATAWYVCGTKHLPWPTEVDNHSALGDGKSYRNTAPAGRDQRIAVVFKLTYVCTVP
jgi:hypothetical protein